MRRKKGKKFLFVLLFLGVCFLFKHYFSFSRNTQIIDVQNVLFSYVDYEIKDKKKFLGILEIPKLSLKQYFYEENSSWNNVDKHVYFVPGSTLPNEKYSNLILAAHSGYSEVSYFRNLDHLSLGDIALVTIDNVQYTYQLVSVYQEEKDGTITIHREKNKSHLTLITCNKTNKNMQDVSIFELMVIY